MSLNFSASQYESAYKPKTLRNWEVPKWYPEKPVACKGTTVIISNDRGHLLPGIERSKKSPWGDFRGTWSLPKKINREAANVLSAPDPVRIQQWKNRSHRRKEQLKELDLKGPKKQEKPKIEEVKAAAETPEDVKQAAEEPPADTDATQKGDCDDDEKRKESIYIPGDLTEDKHKHYTYEKLVRETLHKDVCPKTSAEGYPLYREDFARKEKPEFDLKKESDKMIEEHKKMMKSKHCHHEKKAKKFGDPSAPFMAASKNFQLAKKLHKENLEHEPLPDTITEALFRKIQMQKGSEPGLVLKDGNYATGVGWKGYPGYGATRCTKMKVYRPKTGVAMRGGYIVDQRPASVSSFDKKWRFIRQDKVTPIELAICWDMTPQNKDDEPKRAAHIDGSNESQGPAIFSVVHTPKDNDKEVVLNTKTPVGQLEIKCKKPGSVSSSNSNSSCEDCKLERPKTCWVNKKKQPSASTSSSNSSSSKCSSLKRAKSAYNLPNVVVEEENTNTNTASSSSFKKNHHQNPLHQSSPNLSQSNCLYKNYKYCSKDCYLNKHKPNRICVACEFKNVNLKDKRPKAEFKMAFKAGVPQKTKDKRTDYPEHWRLASVYQHSYKPMHTRKRPLLATVYQ